MQVIRVFAVFSLFESVNLNPERNSFLSSVFARGELSADTMHLQKTKRRRRTLRGVLARYQHQVGFLNYPAQLRPSRTTKVSLLSMPMH